MDLLRRLRRPGNRFRHDVIGRGGVPLLLIVLVPSALLALVGSVILPLGSHLLLSLVERAARCIATAFILLVINRGDVRRHRHSRLDLSLSCDLQCGEAASR